MKTLTLLVSTLLLFSAMASASVFSGQGVGIPLSSVLGAQGGRAGLGIAEFDSNSINLDQPAKNAELNDVRVAFTGVTQNRTLSDHAGNSESQGEFQFGGFAISFPLYNKWRTGLVVAPYTTTNFKSVSPESLNTNPYTLHLNGTGGLTRYGLVTAFRGQGWRFGLEFGALAGSINNGWQAYFTGDSGYSDGWFIVNREMLGVYARPGFIADLGNNRLSVVVQTPSHLEVREVVTYAMTTRTTNTKTSFDMPWVVNGGFATKFDVWQTGVDFDWSQWSAVHSPYFRIQPKDEVGGGVWVEHSGRTGYSASYLARIAWRGGIKYRVLPTLTSNGESVKEWTTAVGATLPTSQASDFLYLSMGYTVRGDTGTNLLQENVFWTAITVSLSEKWFVREQQTRRRN